MMMFMHVVFSFQLLVLMASTAFLVWALRSSGAGKWLAILIGVLTFFASFSSTVCTAVYSIGYWKMEYRSPHMGMQGMPMHHQQMMNGDGPMMMQNQQMMNSNQGSGMQNKNGMKNRPRKQQMQNQTMQQQPSSTMQHNMQGQ